MANFFHLTNNAETFSGTNNVDYILGYGGRDVLYGWGGNDWIFGGDGNDTLYGGEGDDWLVGGDGADRLYSGAGNDDLWGGNGNDIFYGAAGKDHMEGGSGIDWVNYSQSSDGVIVDFKRGRGKDGDARGDTYNSIEMATGSAFDDEFIGDAADNTFYGLAGNDRFAGYGGADSFMGGAGSDDQVSYVASPTGVTVNLSTNINRGGHAEGDRLYSIEKVLGSQFADSITGDGAENYFQGGGGNDDLFGLGGDDYMKGGQGADRIFGGDGDDFLSGDWGDDVLVGGAGADTFYGGDGIDTVDYSLDERGNIDHDGGTIFVDLQANTASGEDAEGDWFSGIENIIGSRNNRDLIFGDEADNRLSGLGGHDELRGRDGDDSLFGGTGNDLLDGGAGADLLSGGNGSDTFVYSKATDSTFEAMDVIDHWDAQWSWRNGSEHDTFNFRSLDADPYTAGNQRLEWIDRAAFDDAGQVREYHVNGSTFVEVNLDNDFNDAEMVIRIAQSVDLNSGDFLM